MKTNRILIIAVITYIVLMIGASYIQSLSGKELRELEKERLRLEIQLRKAQLENLK